MNTFPEKETTLEKIAKDVWKELLKPLLTSLAKIAAVLTVIIVIAYIVMIFMAHSVVKKMANPENKEYQTFASMMPLFCTIKELEDNEDEFDLLADFAYDVENKKRKCTNSIGGAWNCASEAWSTVNDSNKLDRAYRKGKQLNQARKEIKRTFQRAVNRIKAIEPYDDDSAKLKKDILSLAVYVNNNANMWDLAISSERIGKEIERRSEKIFTNGNLKKVTKHLREKYPLSIVLIFSPVYKIFADEDSLKEAAWRSQAFRETADEGACLVNSDEIYITPATIIGVVVLYEMWSDE